MPQLLTSLVPSESPGVVFPLHAHLTFRPQPAQLMTHEVMDSLGPLVGISLLLKDHDDVRASEFEPGYLVAFPHMVARLDAEVDGRHLEHPDGQDGNVTAVGFGVDDDAASRLDKLIAWVVQSTRRELLVALDAVLDGTAWLQHGLSIHFHLVDLKVTETWDDARVFYL